MWAEYLWPLCYETTSSLLYDGCVGLYLDDEHFNSRERLSVLVTYILTYTVFLLKFACEHKVTSKTRQYYSTERVTASLAPYLHLIFEFTLLHCHTENGNRL